MDGQRWGIMVAVSVFLHLFLFSAVIILPDFISYGDIDDIVYEVDLVDMPSNTQMESPSASKAEEPASKTDSSAKRIDAGEEKKTKIEVEKIPLNKKKTTVKKTETSPKTEKNTKSSDANHLSQAMSKLKKKTASEESHLNKAMSDIQSKMSGTGSAGEGTGGSGSIEGLPMRMYQLEVKERIKSNWSYPAAMQNNKDLEATIILKVKEDGTIVQSDFRKKSKDSIFNQSVLKAIEKSDPLPPFPEGYRKSYEELEINFTLKELLDS